MDTHETVETRANTGLMGNSLRGVCRPGVSLRPPWESGPISKIRTRLSVMVGSNSDCVLFEKNQGKSCSTYEVPDFTPAIYFGPQFERPHIVQAEQTRSFHFAVIDDD